RPGYVDEAKNGEQPAPKRAKSAPKSGHTSEGNDPSILSQKNAVVVDDNEQSDQPHVADDTLSLFGGPEFQDIDDELDNDNLLENIAQNLSSRVFKTTNCPPISASLAKIINSKLADEFDAPKLKETLSKYKRPENCEQMYVPEVNQEIWHKMKPFAKKADIKMANLQDTLIKGLSGLANATNTLLECRESKTIPDYRAIVPQLIDTTALFGHVCKELSYK
ncbi:Hypothetical predicted protein, partial [Paramuricea clavata]